MRNLLVVLLVMFTALVVSAKPKEIVCIGDSITEGFGIPGDKRKELRFSAILANLVGDKYKVTNLGFCGRTMLTNVKLSWGGCGFARLKKTKPYIAIIMLGTNDSKMENWKGNAKQFEKDAEDLIDLVRKRNRRAKIFLCYPPPAFSGKKLKTGDGISGVRIKKEIIPILKRVAEKKKVAVIDVFAEMKHHPELFADGVHPNIKGADYLAKFLFKEIKPALK